MKDFGSRWHNFARAAVVLLLIAMVGCQGLSTKQTTETSPGNPLQNPLSISGSITPAGSGSGAKVTLTGALKSTTTADSSGNYSFGSLTSGSYTIAVSKSGVSFSPSSQQVTVNGAQVTGVNFTATGSSNTFNISGTVSPAVDGSGVTVTLTGAANATTTTTSGNYSFTGLANGAYTVTASKSGFTFTPASLPVTVSGADVAGVDFTASVAPITYSISGTITPAANGSGATVTLGGAGSATTTANSAGNYSFTGLANGAYTVTPSKTGFTFTPASSPVTVSGANVAGVNFTATAVSPTTYSISGTITPAANGSGATVTLGGASSATTTADSAGNYSFTGLANGAYTVTPSKSGFTFTPASSPVTVSGANVAGVNFTATAVSPTTYSISGTITPAANGSGATVTLGGASSATTTANSAGNYSFTGLANGAYTVTPSKSGFTFTPASSPVTVSGTNIAGINFTASAVSPTTYSISGTITPAANGSGATVTLGGASSATTTANSAGNYSFTGLANGAYTVTASESGFTFSPTGSPVTVNGANVAGVNFTATAVSPTTYSISGTITPAANGSGATVTLSGTSSATTTANSAGNYTFTGLANGAYTLTPSESGFTFSPTSSPATVNGANVAGVNFTATAVSPTTYSISGSITPAANGSGATLTLSGASRATITANSAGNYSFTGLANGSYTVTARKNGFSFSPVSLPETVSGANITGANFSAYSGPSVTIGPGTGIQGVVDANPPGTTFVFQPGLYRLTSPINPKSGDSFVGQVACTPPAVSCPAILSGSIVIGSSAVYDGVNYKVTGQTQQGLQQYTNKCEPSWLGCFYPEDLFFDGVPLQHLYSASLPTIQTGQWWFDYANHVIYFHDNPSGHKVETSVVPTVAEVPSGPLANNITFQYLTIEEFAAPLELGAIDPTFAGGGNATEGLNWVVENCEILLAHGLGVHINYETQILNSYIHNNGQMGIGGGTESPTNPSRVLVSGNTVSYNNYANVNPAFGAGGIKFGTTLGAVVRGNTVTNNSGAGIHFDTGSWSPLIDGNTVTDNVGGSGIIYEVSLTSALVRNNILQRNGATGTFSGPGYNLQSADSAGVDAYCNLIEVSNLPGENAFIVGAANRGSNPNPPYEYLTSTGNNFHHNTVIWDAGSIGNVGYMEGDATNQPNFFANNTPPDFNTYHQASLTTADFMYDNNDSGANAHKTFAEYQSVGADVNGTADTNYTSGFPTVAISSPADQSSVTSPVTVTASASDPSGISKVEFYVDWTLQATLSSSPYNFDWTGAATGAHTVTAMAYSNAGIRSCFAVTLNKQ